MSTSIDDIGDGWFIDSENHYYFRFYRHKIIKISEGLVDSIISKYNGPLTNDVIVKTLNNIKSK